MIDIKLISPDTRDRVGLHLLVMESKRMRIELRSRPGLEKALQLLQAAYNRSKEYRSKCYTKADTILAAIGMECKRLDLPVEFSSYHNGQNSITASGWKHLPVVSRPRAKAKRVA